MIIFAIYARFIKLTKLSSEQIIAKNIFANTIYTFAWWLLSKMCRRKEKIKMPDCQSKTEKLLISLILIIMFLVGHIILNCKKDEIVLKEKIEMKTIEANKYLELMKLELANKTITLELKNNE